MPNTHETKPLVIRLDSYDRERLEELADGDRCSMTELVRRLIRNAEPDRTRQKQKTKRRA